MSKNIFYSNIYVHSKSFCVHSSPTQHSLEGILVVAIRLCRH